MKTDIINVIYWVNIRSVGILLSFPGPVLITWEI